MVLFLTSYSYEAMDVRLFSTELLSVPWQVCTVEPATGYAEWV